MPLMPSNPSPGAAPSPARSLRAIVEQMRRNVAEPDDRDAGSVWAWRLDEWADAIEAALAAFPVSPAGTRCQDGEHYYWIGNIVCHCGQKNRSEEEAVSPADRWAETAAHIEGEDRYLKPADPAPVASPSVREQFSEHEINMVRWALRSISGQAPNNLGQRVLALLAAQPLPGGVEPPVQEEQKEQGTRVDGSRFANSQTGSTAATVEVFRDEVTVTSQEWGAAGWRAQCSGIVAHGATARQAISRLLRDDLLHRGPYFSDIAKKVLAYDVAASGGLSPAASEAPEAGSDSLVNEVENINERSDLPSSPAPQEHP